MKAAARPDRRAALPEVLRELLAQQRRPLWLGLLLAVLTALMGVGLLGLSGWFITAAGLAGLQIATAIVFDVFMPSAGIRLMALGRTFSRYGERLLTHDGTLGALAAMRERLLRAYAQPEAAQRLQLRPARLLFRLTADIDALESPYLRLLVPAAASLGVALMAGLIVGLQSPLAGLALGLWLLAVGWGAAAWLARAAVRPAARRAQALEALRARSADLVAGQVELLMAGRIEAQRASMAAQDARMARADDELNRREVRGLLMQGGGSALALTGVLLLAAWGVGAGWFGAPVAALMALATLAASEAFAALRRGALEAGRATLAARRLRPALVAGAEAEAEADVGRGAGSDADADAGAGWPLRAPADGRLALRLQGLRYRYPEAARDAMDLPQLQLARGERVALVGASGAGKSTLMALLAGELRPAAGRAEVLPAAWLGQRVDLFQDSLRDNLRLAAPQADDARLLAALAEAGLGEDVAALSRGLDTRLGEGGLGLSGGQARRLAVARLLLADRELWLLDEPTEALDAALAHDLLLRLATRARGRSLVIATHLRREAALADRLLLVAHGHVVRDLRRGEPAFDAALAALRPD